MSAAPVLPVSTAVLERIEDSLYEVEIAVGAITEILQARLNPEHVPFVASTLLAALGESVSQCFDAMSAGGLMRSERQSAEVVHAARA